MKSPSNIIVLAFLAVILFFSCEREPEIPTSLPLSGEWASMSAEMESSEYVSFKDGMLSSFISDNRYQVYANQLWHADRSGFKPAGSWRYSVLGNVLETEDPRYRGEVSITEDTLFMGGRRYLRLDSFNPSYYSRIEMAEEDRKVKCGFEESHHAVSYQLENALPWKVVEASSFSDWISEIQVLDDRITFTVLPSTKNRKGNVMVTYPHAERVLIQVEQSARRSIIVETEQTYDYHSGSYSIPYEIDNPMSGSVLTSESDSEWLKVASVTSKNIEVSVEENNSGSDRTADLILTYPEAEPVTVKVVQTYSSVDIEVSPKSQSADYAGGSFSFSYTISNPREGATLNAASGSSWITDIKVTDNRVSYRIGENNSGSDRTANLNLTYPEAEPIMVNIVQTTYPRILADLSEIDLDYRSQTYTLGYEIENPIDRVNLTVETTASWLDVKVQSNRIDISVTENMGTEPRTASLDLSYSVAAPVRLTVVQSPNPVSTFSVNGVSFDMIKVDGGTFWMGAQDEDPNGRNYDDDASSSESPVHKVTLSEYCIGETEVTQELWKAVMGSNPSFFTGDLSRPVESVNWNDIVNDFLPKLNELLKVQLHGQKFVLPTEAQWEYAARGGSSSQGYKYSGSDDVDVVAWYSGNSGHETHPVGQKSPNELGLYDMSGNAWEWCSDWWQDNYRSGSQTDPVGPTSGSDRVVRGGYWYDSARYCRVSDRGNYGPDYRSFICGFRLALVPSFL